MQIVAQHDAPIRHLFYVKEMGGGMLVTGSWDKTIRYWDLRQALSLHVVRNTVLALPNRCV